MYVKWYGVVVILVIEIKVVRKREDEGGFKRFVESIGSLQSTREYVATILCQVS